MKRILTFTLALMLCLLTLCACGGADNSEIVGTYEIVENIYYDSLVDTAFNPTDRYSVGEKDGKLELSCKYSGISGEVVSHDIGSLKKFSLNKSNFDNIIYGSSWGESFSAESIRKNNKCAWKAAKENAEEMYVLLQNDGAVFLVSMERKEGNISCSYIRKMTLIAE